MINVFWGDDIEIEHGESVNVGTCELTASLYANFESGDEARYYWMRPEQARALAAQLIAAADHVEGKA